MLDWLSDAWKGVTNVVQDVINRIISSITAVINWVTSIYDWAVATIYTLASDLAQGLEAAASALASGIAGVSNWVTANLQKLEDWVGGLFQRAEDFAQGLVNDLKNWASDAISAAINGINNLSQWVITNVWNPLWSAIQQAASYISNVIIPWVESGLASLWNRVYGIIAPLLAPFAELWNFYVTELRDAWTVIKLAWSWIVILAKFPFTMGVDIYRLLTGSSVTSALQLFEDTFTHYSDEFEGYIARWFEP